MPTTAADDAGGASVGTRSKRTTSSAVSSLLPNGRRARLRSPIRSASCSMSRPTLERTTSTSSSVVTAWSLGRIGQAVGEQHEGVAVLDVDRLAVEQRLDHPEHRARPADLTTRPRRTAAAAGVRRGRR